MPLFVISPSVAVRLCFSPLLASGRQLEIRPEPHARQRNCTGSRVDRPCCGTIPDIAERWLSTRERQVAGALTASPALARLRSRVAYA